MTKQQRIADELVAHGFERVPSIGSAHAGFQKGELNVDVGPRGGTICWRVWIVDNKAQSERLTLAAALR